MIDDDGLEELGTEELAKDYTSAETDDVAGAKIWSVYVSEAEKYDQALVESWTSDMAGLLIFAGLFSAILTAFLIESYKTLMPDSDEEMVHLLTQISMQLSGIANGSSIDALPPPPFDPPMSSLVCNLLWFISLGLSLSCALIATLVQQWARDFKHKSEMRSAPVVRARIFAYLYYGLRRFNMHSAVEAIPLLLHFSLVFFFMGLVAFLVPVNDAVMILSLLLLGLTLTVYITLTIFPLFSYDSPYRTPLSSGLWRGMQYLKGTWRDRHDLRSRPRDSMVDTMNRIALRDSKQRAIRDHRALCWTVRSLADDFELEPFLEGIPDVLWSTRGRRKAYDQHLKVLLRNPQVRLLSRLQNFLRGCDSDLLPQEIKNRRRITALKALWAIATLPHDSGVSLEPLEPFDFTLFTLVLPTALPFKVAYYQVSADAVLQLNAVLALLRGVHDINHSYLDEGQRKAWDTYSRLSLHDLSSRLGEIVARLNRLPRRFMQASSDREIVEQLGDLAGHIPHNVVENVWRTSCVETLNSLKSALIRMEHDIFVSFMIDAATLESWPYEFETTRKIFDIDGSSISVDMAETFSTAFDSIVSEQTRRQSYSTHADEILAILLDICGHAMADDVAYYPLNLTNYLMTQTASDSAVLKKCDNVWLCSCLTAELVARQHDSSPLSARVIEGMWRVAFKVAQHYLWPSQPHASSQTPHPYQRALEALHHAASPSHIKLSTTALIQTNILNAHSSVVQRRHKDDYNEAIYKIQTRILLKSRPVVDDFQSGDRDNAGSELSILDLRIAILSDFISGCDETNQLPYHPLETAKILMNVLPCRPGVTASQQLYFAESLHAAFSEGSVFGFDLMEELVTSQVFSAYWEGPKTWGTLHEYRWLDDPHAAWIFNDWATKYIRTCETAGRDSNIGPQ
ncbi:hypothetical protein R3P38DRAFT_2639017 [Favolaschia claudopus]|uniref:DUF6535 domain-containing protein n=1 Tax=Favolaschia claudopus TaxID=2862362 RepID=A0AAW0ALB7_9AGAR